jgi:hydrogenase expression/formation protein HypD
MEKPSIDLSKIILRNIDHIAHDIGKPITLMHICGTHEYVIAKNALRPLLPSNVHVISGPGCPVCVCPASDIDLAIELSQRPEVILTTFGDMLRVPATELTLFEAKAKGADVRIVYGPHDAVELAEKYPDREVIFFAIGFETTAPLPAFEVFNNPPPNFSIICANKLVPPAMDLLLQHSHINLDGFILPGHVCSIIGSDPFIPYAEKYHSPMVVCGFEVNDVLVSIYYLLHQIFEGTAKVENTYDRVVKPGGNPKAQEYMNLVFEPRDSIWRGIGMVPQSGLYLREEYRQYDAVAKFGIELNEIDTMPPGCLCTQVLLGQCGPNECPHFGKNCTPIHPIGPCMVSHEGTCKINYTYHE